MGKEYGSYPVSEWGKLQDKRILKRNQEEIKFYVHAIREAQKNIEEWRRYIREDRKDSREILRRD